MNVRVEVVCLNAAGDEQRRQVLTIEARAGLAMETLGMNLTEGQSVVGRRAGFCSLPTGSRRVGATTCLSTLPQAVHDQGLRQHPS